MVFRALGVDYCNLHLAMIGYVDNPEVGLFADHTGIAEAGEACALDCFDEDGLDASGGVG